MRGGKTIDILLVLCLGYAIYTFGRFIGDHDGYQLGYMHGYSSFWKDAYDHLRNSLVMGKLTIMGKLTRVYRTVKIGEQVWMAQNLAYEDAAATISLQGQMWCYYDSTAMCETFGRLYSWSAMMGFNTSMNEQLAGDLVQEKHRGICPEGYHVPSDGEWTELANYVDAHNGAEGIGVSLKARYLWRQDTTLRYQHITMGSDLYGWAGLPGDNYVASESVTINGKKFVGFDGHAGLSGLWWSSTESAASTATERNLNYYHEALSVIQGSKSSANSVRCLRD